MASVAATPKRRRGGRRIIVVLVILVLIVVGIVVTILGRAIYNPFDYNHNPLGNAGISIGADFVMLTCLFVATSTDQT